MDNNKALPVIDAHTHIFPDKVADKAKDNVGEFYHLDMCYSGKRSILQKIRTQTFENRQITKQLICSPSLSESQTKSINEFIANECKKDNCFIGFGTLHRDNLDYKDHIKYIKQLGLKGIKFHPDFQEFDIDDEKMIEVYKEIAKNGLPVIFHMGDETRSYSAPEKLHNAMKKVPDMVVIAAHMGGYSQYDKAYKVLERCDNLFFDVSSTMAFLDEYSFKKTIDKFGESQFFFGSDFPMWDPIAELKRLKEMKLDENLRRMIEYNNFASLISNLQ